MKTIELQVQGMSCGSCVKHVTEALRMLNGVSEVAVDLKLGRVTVGGNSDCNELLSALENAGYPVQASIDAQSEKKTSGCGGNSGCCCSR
ncbi:Copper-transporting P-type ATPase [compost metagenome]